MDLKPPLPQTGQRYWNCSFDADLDLDDNPAAATTEGLPPENCGPRHSSWTALRAGDAALETGASDWEAGAKRSGDSALENGDAGLENGDAGLENGASDREAGAKRS